MTTEVCVLNNCKIKRDGSGILPILSFLLILGCTESTRLGDDGASSPSTDTDTDTDGGRDTGADIEIDTGISDAGGGVTVTSDCN